MLFENKTLKSWAYYDFANSSYVLIFQSFLLPIFFIKNIHLQFVASWGAANSISTLLGLLLAIVAGSYSDRNERLKAFKILIWITFVFMALLSIMVAGYPLLVFYFYIFTNALFISTISLSDSLLTFISSKENANRYSGIAWGWGYLGGIICLIFVTVLQHMTSEYSSYVFLFVSLFYLVFSLFALNGLSKKTEIFQPELEETEKPMIETRNRFWILFGYWLISECITIIILFFSIFASTELKLNNTYIGIILLSVQVIGIFTTWIGGKLADKHASINLLGYSVILWGIVICLLIFTHSVLGLILITVCTGFVIGNSQSYLRAQYSKITRKSEAGFQFGLYSISSQAAVIVGPLLFGLTSNLLGSQKIPLGVTGCLMIIGYFIIKRNLRNIGLTNNEKQLI